ncbi:MAG TPA: aromatic ring-hydroxylating dioxygenase subunit alpha, partial [Chloroflexota bacterium]
EVAHPDAKFKDRITIKSYPVKECAGLLWAYMGPLPAPELPVWEPFTWGNGFIQIVLSEIPCNWFQCQENSIDPVHFEWLHSNWSQTLRNQDGPKPPTHLRIAFNEFEYGFQYKRILEGQPEDSELWNVGRVCLWPNALFTGGHFEWRVPVDDDTTLSVGWFFDRVPNEMEPFEQGPIPYWYGPIKDPFTGRWINSHVMNQDFIAWAGQGALADRSQEHLGESDRGVIMMRRRMLEQANVVAQGGEPRGLIREAAHNECVPLPIVGRKRFVEGYPMSELGQNLVRQSGTPGTPGFAPEEFIFQAGQPREIKEAYCRAMGLRLTAEPRFA